MILAEGITVAAPADKLPVGDHRPKSRSTAAVVAAFLGIVLSAFLIVTAVPAPRTAASVGAAAPGTAAEAPTRTPDEHLCLEVSSIVEDSATEVAQYRHDGRAERISRLRAAEDQLGRYSHIADPGCATSCVDGERDRWSPRGPRVRRRPRAATDAVLRRIDALDAACGRGPAPTV